MSQILNLKVKGLFTSYNEFSEAPEGALLKADNIEIKQDSIAEPRRGFERLTGDFTSAPEKPKAITYFKDKLIANVGSDNDSHSLYYYNSSAWTSLGTFNPPSTFRMRFVQDNQNLYFTSSAGVYKMEDYNSTPVIAGAYKALDVTGSLSGSSGFLADTKFVAYRILWGYKDANNNLILGAPSARAVVENDVGGGAERDVSLTFTIPDGVTTSWFYQIYRSEQSATSEPSDELGLVYEDNPSSAEITAGTITVVDIVPDELRGATIYTASTQEGLVNQNEQPPLAKDMCVFRDSVFYFNTTSKHRYYLTLIAVDGSNGLVADDTISIGGVTYTAKTAETITNAEFLVETLGSAATNIADTALSLVKVINQHANSTVYAYYISGPDDLPGQILLEEKNIGGAAFVITASRATCWSPTDIPSSGSTETSSNDEYENGVFWSKPNQPEAVPLPNFVTIGSKNNPILRGIALREAIYVFKENEGVFKISGYYPNFQVDKVDDSVNLIAPETAQVLNNQIYCLSDQGITVVTDSTKVISRPIEQDLLEVINQNFSLVQSVGFGLAYESERKYYIFLPQTSADTYPTQAYVYNIFTNTWVRHLLNASTAFVAPGNILYLGSTAGDYLLKERQNYSYLDYADYLSDTSITSASGTTITIDSGIDTLTAGDILYQSASLFAIVESIDLAAGEITVSSNPGLTVADVTLLRAVATEMTWVPVTMRNPGVKKQFHTTMVLFKESFSGSATLSYTSDLDQSSSSTTLTGLSLSLWGSSVWGTDPWGGEVLKKPTRQWIPRSKQRASQLTVTFTHRWGFSNWKMVGISIYGTVGSEKIMRQ